MRIFLFLIFNALATAQAAGWPVFVDAGWVSEHLGQPRVKLLEISDAVSYEFDGHIPGAVLTSKEYWRQQGEDGVRTHLPIAELQQRIRALGVNQSDHVVLYYKGHGTTEVQGAFYAFWIFNLLGHDAVSILNGGWHAWQAARGPVEERKAESVQGDFTASHRPELEMNVETLHALHRDHPVVDGRPRDYWLGLGKFEANIKFGRIPGSLSQPWESFLRVDDAGLTYADASLPIGLLEQHPLDKKELVLLTCFGAAGAAIVYVYFKAAGFEKLRVDDEGYLRWNLRNYPLVSGPP